MARQHDGARRPGPDFLATLAVGMSYDDARIRNALPEPASQYGDSPGGTYDYFGDEAY